MVGLPDIASLKLKHELRKGVTVEYSGLSGGDIAALMVRFPEVKKIFSQQSLAELTMESFSKLIPKIGVAVIAAGLGCPGDDKQEKIAANLPLGEQMELASMIWKATIPKGLDSFVEGLEAFGLGGLSSRLAAANGMDPDGTSRSPSNGSSVLATSPQK